MLLPRFSLRTMLAILTVVAVVSLMAGQALSGRAWALGVTVAAVSVAFTLVVHAGFFVLASLAARFLGPSEITAHTSRGGVERTTVGGTTTPAPLVDHQISPPATP